MADFKEALQKAKKMIHNDAKNDAHIIKERVADRNQAKYFRDQPSDAFSSISSVNSLRENTEEDNDYRLDAALSDMTTRLNETVRAKQQVQPQVPQRSVLANIKNSKMPKAILESLSENYIDQSKLAEGYSTGLDSIITEDMIVESNEPERPVIRETVQPAGGVDYSLIKTIVEDCVRKYASSITKKVLSEQKNIGLSDDQLRAIRIGESFTFITSNGDLYEAELKFKKNINKSTKKGS